MADSSQQFHVTGTGVDVHLLAQGDPQRPPTLLVPGLAAGPAGFILHPRRSVAEMVSDLGRTPWLVDFDLSWRSRGQGAATLFRALELALAELCDRTGTPPSEVDAVGHSMGGILVLGLLADGVPLRRVVTLASAVDYRSAGSPLTTALSRLPNGLGPLRGRVGGGLPVQRIAEVASPLFGRGLPIPVQSDQFYPGTTPGSLQRRYLREASRDLPIPLLIDLAELYTERGLRLGAETRPLRQAVADIATPVMLVAARQDRQCPLVSVQDAARAIPGAILHEVGHDGIAAGYAHVDVLLGRHAPEEILVPVERFFMGKPLAHAVGA